MLVRPVDKLPGICESTERHKGTEKEHGFCMNLQSLHLSPAAY